MSRTGVAIALLFVLGLIAFASLVHVTGPGWSGTAPDSGARIAQARLAGPLGIPVQGVASTALADSWTDPRGGGTRVHHAIDVMAPTGTAVLAAADGRIEKLFDSALGGHTIYERSADGGTVYYYAHLDRYAPTLVAGQVVRAGQVIAAVGSSGNADPGAPHLHFEVHRLAPSDGWWQGAEVNPYPLLAGNAAAR
jgi:murein DD-endopeptidase MepM/ murein hydrolase activator NlpD